MKNVLCFIFCGAFMLSYGVGAQSIQSDVTPDETSKEIQNELIKVREIIESLRVLSSQETRKVIPLALVPPAVALMAESVLVTAASAYARRLITQQVARHLIQSVREYLQNYQSDPEGLMVQFNLAIQELKRREQGGSAACERCDVSSPDVDPLMSILRSSKTSRAKVQVQPLEKKERAISGQCKSGIDVCCPELFEKFEKTGHVEKDKGSAWVFVKGIKGKQTKSDATCCLQWDQLHNDIEIFSNGSKQEHLGSRRCGDAVTPDELCKKQDDSDHFSPKPHNHRVRENKGCLK